MSKRIQQLMALFAFTAVALAAACANDATGPLTRGGSGPAEIAQMTVEPGHVILNLGAAVQLQAELTDRDGTPLGGLREPIQWSSSKPDVAAVSASGVVVALAPGKTVITADCGNHCAYANVTVLPPGHIDPPVDTARAPAR